jgi:phosphoglycolate phosphatase
MNFKAVIFDLDGTLVNSIEDLGDSMNEVLRNYNYPTHSYEAYENFIGSGIRSLVVKALPENQRDEAQINRGFDDMMHVYRSQCTNKTKPYEGIIELLDQLKARQLKLSVLSNKADEFTKKIVQNIFPGYFDSIHGLSLEAHKKPNPIKAIEISKNLGINAEEIIYIGDTGIDMQTATNANMHAVGVLWGFRSKDELIENGAKYILRNSLDLIAIL